VTEARRQRIRQLTAVTCAALVLGAGLVLAAQGPGRADQSARITDKERQPMWVPGTNVPMSAYIDAEDGLPLAPPR
jgi:hypothetical protein